MLPPYSPAPRPLPPLPSCLAFSGKPAVSPECPTRWSRWFPPALRGVRLLRRLKDQGYRTWSRYTPTKARIPMTFRHMLHFSRSLDKSLNHSLVQWSTTIPGGRFAGHPALARSSCDARGMRRGSSSPRLIRYRPAPRDSQRRELWATPPAGDGGTGGRGRTDHRENSRARARVGDGTPSSPTLYAQRGEETLVGESAINTVSSTTRRPSQHLVSLVSSAPPPDRAAANGNGVPEQRHETRHRTLRRATLSTPGSG